MSAQSELRAAIKYLETGVENTSDPDIESDIRTILDRCYRLDAAIRDVQRDKSIDANANQNPDQIWVGKVTQRYGDEVLFHGTTKDVVRSHIEAFVAEWWDEPVEMWTEDPAEGYSEIGHGKDNGEIQEAVIFPHKVHGEPASDDEYVFQPEGADAAGGETT